MLPMEALVKLRTSCPLAKFDVMATVAEDSVVLSISFTVIAAFTDAAAPFSV